MSTIQDLFQSQKSYFGWKLSVFDDNCLRGKWRYIYRLNDIAKLPPGWSVGVVWVSEYYMCSDAILLVWFYLGMCFYEAPSLSIDSAIHIRWSERVWKLECVCMCLCIWQDNHSIHNFPPFMCSIANTNINFRAHVQTNTRRHCACERSLSLTLMLNN